MQKLMVQPIDHGIERIDAGVVVDIAYQQWIDRSLRAHYPDAPTTPADVQKTANEGNSGTTCAYFLLQFTGVRGDPEQVLSVGYASRDGTAKAGMDYLATAGTLDVMFQ